jgi:serine/threonine protein kinase
MKKKRLVRVIESVELHARTALTNLIHEMLEVNPKDRPSAQELHTLFNILIRPGSHDSVPESESPLLLKISRSLSDDESEESKSKNESTAYVP